MRYSIDFGRDLEREVRRIARRRLHAAAALLTGRDEGLDEAIHDARRHIKQCRSLYRLVCGPAPAFRMAENDRLRGIAGDLSALRDAAALLEVAAYLKREVATKSNAMLMDRLARRLELRRQHVTGDAIDVEDKLETASRALGQAATALDHLGLPHLPAKTARCIADGWSEVNRKARRALSLSEGPDRDTAFHDLRKRCQDRWMHAGLLRDLWPTAMTAIRRQAKALSDQLGHVQDLAMLLDALAASPDLAGDEVEGEALRDVILTQQDKLQRDCRAAGAELFRKSKPSDAVVIARLVADRRR